jgi:hypothetical protein
LLRPLSTYVKEVYNDSIALSAAGAQQVAPKRFNAYGHISKLFVDITLTIVETTATQAAVTAARALDQLIIRDKNQKEIIKCTGAQIAKMRRLMTRMPSLHLDEYRKAEYDAGSNIGATGGNYRVELPVNIPPELQPLTLEYTATDHININSVIGDAVSTLSLKVATMSIVEKIPDELAVYAKTNRFSAMSLGTVADEQAFQQRLMDGSLINAVQVDVTADANVTDYTFKSAGNVGIEKLLERYIQMFEARAFDDGHITGLYILPLPPMVVTPQTDFRLNASASHTPVLYQAYRLPGEREN